MLFRKFKVSFSIKNFFIVFSLFSVVYFAKAQEEKTIDLVVHSITEHDLKRHLSIIAHDSLEGRETGQEGLKKAANYLQSQFKEIGLSPVNIGGKDTYFQTFPLYREKCGEIFLTVNGNTYKNMEDILFVRSVPETSKSDIEVVFIGHGNAEDYKKLNFSNKGVVLLNSENSWKDQVETALDAGVKDIFIVYGAHEMDMEILINQYDNYYQSTALRMNPAHSDRAGRLFFITGELAEEIFNRSMKSLNSAADRSLNGKYRAMKKIPAGSLSYSIACWEEKIYTENVLGIVEGMENPDEVVVISAHYDHMGMQGEEIYNGADDNGSGTVAVLELADAYATAKRKGLGPKRSVLFILMTGEEKGLLGSSHYVKNPVFPLSKTTANFNIDMIGRIDKFHMDNPDYVYLIGSDKISPELHNISERTNDEFIGLVLDYKYNADDDPERFYYRSDHYNFAKKGIPVIFYFTGVHEDYHRPTDVVEKIKFPRMERITKLIFYTSWNVANKEGGLSRK
jgi:hypothetical protein